MIANSLEMFQVNAFSMIQLKDILIPSRVLVNVNVASKKRALEVIAKTVVTEDNQLDELDIFEQLIERERLGSTGFGNGVAIPHCRIAACPEPIAVLLRLATAIDFDAVDEGPVDLLVGLIVPEAATDEHLQLLRQVAELLGNADIRTEMREAQNSEILHQIVVNALTNI